MKKSRDESNMQKNQEKDEVVQKSSSKRNWSELNTQSEKTLILRSGKVGDQQGKRQKIQLTEDIHEGIDDCSMHEEKADII